MRTALLLLLTACPEPATVKPQPLFGADDPPADADDTGSWSGDGTQVSGRDLDAGFGSAVLVSGSRVWASAPHGTPAKVYRIEDGVLTSVAQGPGRLGSSLAMSSSGLWMGAPLRNNGAGAVVDLTGEIAVEGSASTGIAMISGSPAVVAHGDGYSTGSGSITATEGRPTSIARIGEKIGIGLAAGDIALQSGSLTLARPSPSDAAGFSLTSGDLDGDGTKEWILGAPAAAAVHIISASTLTIQHTLSSEHGGFGAALCAADFDGDGQDELLVGAPAAALSRGMVLSYANATTESSPAADWTGDEVGDRLGTAIGCSDQVAAMGAPGGALSTGYVKVEPSAAIVAASEDSASRPRRPRSE